MCPWCNRYITFRVSVYNLNEVLSGTSYFLQSPESAAHNGTAFNIVDGLITARHNTHSRTKSVYFVNYELIIL